MIPYWKEFGINAVELMPAYEFMERSTVEPGKAMIRQKHHKDKVNYWADLRDFILHPRVPTVRRRNHTRNSVTW